MRPFRTRWIEFWSVASFFQSQFSIRRCWLLRNYIDIDVALIEYSLTFKKFLGFRNPKLHSFFSSFSSTNAPAPCSIRPIFYAVCWSKLGCTLGRTGSQAAANGGRAEASYRRLTSGLGLNTKWCTHPGLASSASLTVVRICRSTLTQAASYLVSVLLSFFDPATLLLVVSMPKSFTSTTMSGVLRREVGAEMPSLSIYPLRCHSRPINNNAWR